MSDSAAPETLPSAERSTQELCDAIIKAHNDAMMALAADVHPYTQSAIDAHEQTIRDNLVALGAAARGPFTIDLAVAGIEGDYERNVRWSLMYANDEGQIQLSWDPTLAASLAHEMQEREASS